MGFTLADSVLRPTLHTDILTAWTPTRIFDNEPQTAGVGSQLPRAFLQLTDITPQRGPALKDYKEVHAYKITGQFAWPSSGTVEAAKVAKAQAILDILTAAVTYAGWTWHVDSILFHEDVAQGQEPFYTVEINFSLEVVTNGAGN